MSKLILGLVSGLGIWTVGMGAAAATGFSGNKLRVLSTDSSISKLTSLNEMMKSYEEFYCINSLFKKINWNTTNIEVKALTNEGIKGCLSVWWEKEIYDEGRWQGSWNLLWTIKDNNYGKMFLYNIKAENGKIDRSFSFYSLKKGEEADEWLKDNQSVSVYHETASISPNTELIDKSSGWDFETDTDKICSSTNQCTSNSPKRIFTNLRWDFVSGTSFVYTWIHNINNLINCNNIKNHISQIKGSFKLFKNQESSLKTQ